MSDPKPVHVPRAIDYCGKSASEKAEDREWDQASRSWRPKRTQRQNPASLNTIILHEQRRPSRWKDYKSPG